MASVAFPSIAKKAKLSDGTTYGYVYVPAKDSKPTLLFLHGCPSSSYDWRMQIEHLPKLGYGLIVPDLLGYGDTDKPAEIEKYQLKFICPQVIELLDLEGLETVIGIAHDWGTALLSRLVTLWKSRFTALGYIATGYADLSEPFDTDFVNAATKKAFGYSTSGYFRIFNADDGAAMLEKAHKTWDSLMYTADPKDWITYLGEEGGLKGLLEEGKILPMASWISPEEIDMHSKIVTGGGYTGPLNWYKALLRIGPSDADKALTPEQKKTNVPVLMVVTEKDYIVRPDGQLDATKNFAANVTEVRKNTGHWVMLEDREGLEKTLEDWLASL